MSLKEHNLIAKIALFSAPIIYLLISPGFSAEPVDLPKLTVLVFFGFFLVPYNFSNFKFNFTKNRFLVTIATLFLTDLTLVLFLSSANLTEQLFGSFGRNTGYLAYFSLVSIFLFASISANKDFASKSLVTLIWCGTLTVIYGMLQTFKADPIKWSNPYNPILGFVGNPDFAASFLAMSALATLIYFFKQDISISKKYFIFIQVGLELFLIVRSKAIQGLMVFFAGLAIIIFIFLTKSYLKKAWQIGTYLVFSILSGATVLFGTLNIGPLAHFLYKTSVRQRGFYWDAATNMMQKHPAFGVGLDNYGSWYLSSRSLNAAQLSPTTMTNTAHNVFLDIGSNGGFPLFILYITLNVYVLVVSIKKLSKDQQFDWIYSAVFTVWIGYTLQSIVSINQLGLAVWGWLFMGLLLGMAKNSESINNGALKQPFKISKGKSKSSSTLLLSSIVFGVAGLLIAGSSFINDHNYMKAINSRNAENIINAVNAKPLDLNRIMQAAKMLASSNLREQALALSKTVVNHNPRSIEGWRAIQALTTSGSIDFKIAEEKIKILNPNENLNK